MNILHGKRVMVVEDELLVAMMIEDILLDEECTVLGPYTNLADALQAATTEQMDLAVLDVNLRGEKIYPVARMLSDRGVPFLLLSGYGADAIPLDQPGWRACAKPFTPEDLTRMLGEQIQESARLAG
jgi:DNA-binding response OmpR family regulator